ncbi:hypothetical protein V4F30_22220 [Rhodococcus sp. IITD102]|uniref:hypothetical protein n=1 Tax=Rhodococcus sp. IITD102 TaxID=3119531 RepID=UPI002FC36C69
MIRRFTVVAAATIGLGFASAGSVSAEPETPWMDFGAGCRFASISADCRWETFSERLSELLSTGSAEPGTDAGLHVSR